MCENRICGPGSRMRSGTCLVVVKLVVSYMLSRGICSQFDHLYSLHNILLALGLLPCGSRWLVRGSRPLPNTRTCPLSVRGWSLFTAATLNSLDAFSVFGEFIHDLSILDMFFACQTVTARNAMPQYTGPRKSEARPFAQKPICWLMNKPSIPSRHHRIG